MAPNVPDVSPLTGAKVPPHYIHSSSAFFRDTSGRSLLLRGINLSGSSKAPLGQPSQRIEGFWEAAESGDLSFVGQPLDLDDGSADVHLARLRAWGFNCLRWVFTWEALEHAGPGKYDFEYMDYVVAVLRKVKSFGFKVYMDPHQDVFSRYTGGSGGPYWTLPACGINPRHLTATQAAFLHCEWPSPEDPNPIEFPDMLWASGYTRLAGATLSILFFAGRAFAPKCIIDGKNIQDWLQEHFLGAVRQLAIKIRDAGDLLDDCVIGWDSINEPNPTYVGLEDLTVLPEKWKLRKGPVPTPLQSMRLGTGQKQTVEYYVFKALGPKRQGNIEVDPKGKSIWMTAAEDAQKGSGKYGWKRDKDWPLGTCVWAAHGVWDVGTGEILRKDYFQWLDADDGPGGRKVDFIADHWLPHWRSYRDTIRPVHPEAIMFIQPPVFEPPPKELTREDLGDRACVSCHFYDGLTLITKHWNWFNADAVGLLRGKYSTVLGAVRFGAAAVRKVMRDQLGYLRHDTLDVLGQWPTLIGEIGIPYDLDRRKAYFGDSRGRGIGDYSSQQAAWDASLNACDGENVLSYTAWTYCPDNTHMWGEGWNGEDLSIWSKDDVATHDPEVEVADLSSPSRTANSSMGSLPIDKLANSATLTATSTATSGRSTPSRPILSNQQTKTAAESHLKRFVARLASQQQNKRPLTAADHVALNDGARALPAVCRPFPSATVGKPLSIDFDIKSSTFKYSLEVTSEELEHAVARGHATEVFVPFVHYAPQRFARAVVEPRAARGLLERDGSVDSSDDEGEPGSASYRDDPEEASELVSIDVQLSSGSYEVRGQTLWWRFDETTRPGRHNLTLKRSGGALPHVQEESTLSFLADAASSLCR